MENYKWSSHQAYCGKKKESDWLCMDWLAFWGKQKKNANRSYTREIKNCFGKPPYPLWESLKGGIVLGGEKLLEKTKEIIGQKETRDELRWIKKEEVKAARDRIVNLVNKEKDRRIKIWIRVRLGGERMVELAREYGYKDGSGVLQTIKRLENKSGKDQQLKRKMDKFLNMSRIKS